MTMNKQKIVIVGAGMAGLTAAAYLLRDGYDIVLLDKNDRCGGLLSTFNTNGFFFDSGPRAFVNSGIVKPILNDLGMEWEFLENKISIGVADQMLRFDSMDAIQDYQRMLTGLFPQNAQEIEKITAISSELSEYTRVLYEFDNPNFSHQMNDRKFIFRKLIPWTFKFLHALRKFEQFNIPMEAFLRRYTANPSLSDVLLQHFFKHTPAYFALGYYYVYLDYFYPRGGTGVLADLLKNKIQEAGGEIRLNTRIAAVNPAEKTVTDADGQRYAYDRLIWAADLKTLYRSLNQTDLDAKVSAQIETKARQTLAAKGAESVFILFLAVNRPPDYFRARGGEHLFYTPSTQGLGETNQAEREKLLEAFERTSKAEILDWAAKFCDLNTFEVSVPALRDPALAPEGQTGLMISFLTDYRLMEKINAAGWYDEFKAALEERVVRIFSQTLYPGLAEDLLFKFSATPLTIHQVSGSSEGAITGWSFETEVPVVNKLKDIPKSVLTPIPGVYQAGQWAYSPAGVPIAMLTGWYAAQRILKDDKKAGLTR